MPGRMRGGDALRPEKAKKVERGPEAVWYPMPAWQMRAAGGGALKAKQASGGRTEASVSGGNGMTQQIEAVQRMQDYIEQHLAGEITPAGPGPGRAVFALVCVPAVPAAHRADAGGLYPSAASVPLRHCACGTEAAALQTWRSSWGSAAWTVSSGRFFARVGCNPGEYAGKACARCAFLFPTG